MNLSRAGATNALLSSVLVLIAACSPSLGPQDVAERFWRATVAQQPATAARYVVARDRDLVSGGLDVLPVAHYSFRRVVIENERATVATEVTLAGDAPVALLLDTRLQREDDTWRVDYQATMQAISAQSELAAVIARIGTLGEALRDGIDQSTAELERALPALERELARLEAEIRQRVPALRERLREFTRQLEKAFEPPPPRPTPSTPPPAADAIAL
jgi:hypothetical protein